MANGSDDDDPLCCEAVRAGIRDVRGLRDVCSDVRGLWSHSGVAPDAPVSLMLILVDPGSWCHSVPW